MKTLKILGLAMSLALAAEPLAITAAEAAPLPVKPVAVTGESLAVQVRHERREHRRFHYDRHRHGPRYHHRHGRYRYYYGGYYYASPFWLNLGPVGVGIGGYPMWSPGWRNWCVRRYHSFNPHTGRYYNGRSWVVCRYGY